jgi:hypothetical protein
VSSSKERVRRATVSVATISPGDDQDSRMIGCGLDRLDARRIRLVVVPCHRRAAAMTVTIPALARMDDTASAPVRRPR